MPDRHSRGDAAPLNQTVKAAGSNQPGPVPGQALRDVNLWQKALFFQTPTLGRISTPAYSEWKESGGFPPARYMIQAGHWAEASRLGTTVFRGPA
jgi:hypothetical protein